MMRTSRASIRAMTLIEVLAVVVILGLLAVTLVIGISGKMGKAKHEIARTQMAQIVEQLETYKMEKHQYPSASDGLAVLSADPSSMYYLEPGKLNDPWGNPYQYIVPGPNGIPFEVVSLGSDGQPGGTGEAADLSSADLTK